MRKLSVIVISVPLLLLSTLSAAPAEAQVQGIAGPVAAGPSPVWKETGHIRDSIRDGRKSGQLSRREAKALRREARRIDHVANWYAQDGLSESEARELESRAIFLEGLVDAQRINGAYGPPDDRKR